MLDVWSFLLRYRANLPIPFRIKSLVWRDQRIIVGIHTYGIGYPQVHIHTAVCCIPAPKIRHYPPPPRLCPPRPQTPACLSLRPAPARPAPVAAASGPPTRRPYRLRVGSCVRCASVPGDRGWIPCSISWCRCKNWWFACRRESLSSVSPSEPCAGRYGDGRDGTGRDSGRDGLVSFVATDKYTKLTFSIIAGRLAWLWAFWIPNFHSIHTDLF